METHKKFNHNDKYVLKSIFKAYPRAKCIVDLQKQEAYLISNNVKIAEIEKHPDQWGIRLTAPVRVKFVESQIGNKPVVYALLKSIYESIKVVVDDINAINFINRQFIVPENQLFTFTGDKNNVLFACIEGIEFNVKRSEWNRMAAFKRNIIYKVKNL